MELAQLLKKISLKEYQEFILWYSPNHPEFKTELEVYFAEKDEKADLDKKYRDWIRKTIRKYEHRGYIDYKGSRDLSYDIDNIINSGFALVEKQNFLDAFVLVRIVLKETMNVLTYCDDSSGSIGGTMEYGMQLLERIINHDYAANPLKEQIFAYLEKALREDVYFDYGHFGYQLFSLFQNLAVKLGHHDEVLNYLDDRILKVRGPYKEYENDFYKIQKIHFLTEIDRSEEANQLIAESLDLVEIRQGEVEKAINGNDYEKAKLLIEGGMQIARDKQHPGTVSNWEKQLLRIAFLEDDVNQIRQYSRYFAFNRGFNKEYYTILKGTYLPEEWKEIIEDHIKRAIDKVLNVYERFTPAGRQNQSLLSLLSDVASVYIEEGYLDRLMELVKKEDNLDNILYYHHVLVKDYAANLLQIYLPAMMKSGMTASDRKQYKDLVKKMQRIVKGKAQIIAVAKELKIMYYRRPAMVEELNKLIN